MVKYSKEGLVFHILPILWLIQVNTQLQNLQESLNYIRYIHKYSIVVAWAIKDSTESDYLQTA
jgi:hypothetical protein